MPPIVRSLSAMTHAPMLPVHAPTRMMSVLLGGSPHQQWVSATTHERSQEHSAYISSHSRSLVEDDRAASPATLQATGLAGQRRACSRMGSQGLASYRRNSSHDGSDITGPDLYLYDTATRQKRLFTVRDPDRTQPGVDMYVCGVTVYDFSHIGGFDEMDPVTQHVICGTEGGLGCWLMCAIPTGVWHAEVKAMTTASGLHPSPFRIPNQAPHPAPSPLPPTMSYTFPCDQGMLGCMWRLTSSTDSCWIRGTQCDMCVTSQVRHDVAEFRGTFLCPGDGPVSWCCHTQVGPCGSLRAACAHRDHHSSSTRQTSMTRSSRGQGRRASTGRA